MIQTHSLCITLSHSTPQDMDLEPSLTPSHITVTYLSRDEQRNEDDDFVEEDSTQRPDTRKYKYVGKH